MMVLYGLGTTIGAGIYALVGKLAATSGYLAPMAFLLASCMAGLTAISFAEMSSRYPRAAGVALYMKQAFDSDKLSLLAGLMVATAGVVSASALINGFIGYLNEFIILPRLLAIVIICLLLGTLAAWGVAESVMAASIVTLIEIGGLIMVIAFGSAELLKLPDYLPLLIPSVDLTSWGLISSGVFLAFYAFIGFEDMVDVAEEVKDVRRNLPRAILLTLIITTLTYMLVMITAILAVPLEQLAASDAPLAAVIEHSHHGGPTLLISVIALFAIINGALIQLIMASRVIYGMASRRQIPRVLGRVSPRTRTPLIATALITSAILTLSVIGELAILAEATSIIMLGVFTLVNLALIVVKRRAPYPEGVMVFPSIFPYAGLVVSGGFVLKAAWDALS